MSDEKMNFPEDINDFINDYSFNDKDEVYTNGSDLIPVFRVKQALEHYRPSNICKIFLIDCVIGVLKNIKSPCTIEPKTIFISIGMHGISDDAVEKRINEVTNKLFDEYGEDITCVHNLKTKGTELDGRRYYLGEAIKKMDKCNTIYMCRGWEAHSGCIVEFLVAKLYGMRIIYEW